MQFEGGRRSRLGKGGWDGSTQSLSDDRGGAHIACSRSARSSTTRRSIHNCKRPIIRLPSTSPLWLQPSENLSLSKSHYDCSSDWIWIILAIGRIQWKLEVGWMAAVFSESFKPAALLSVRFARLILGQMGRNCRWSWTCPPSQLRPHVVKTTQLSNCHQIPNDWSSILHSIRDHTQHAI